MKAIGVYLGIIGMLLGSALFFRSLPHIQGMLVTGALVASSVGITYLLCKR